MRWARWRFTPSPAASFATITRTLGSLMKSSTAFRRSSRPTLLAPKPVADLSGEVAEGVAGLGEDDELSPLPTFARHERVVEDAVELPPFRVLAGPPHGMGLGLQALKDDDLGTELGDSPGGGGLVNQCVLGLL